MPGTPTVQLVLATPGDARLLYTFMQQLRRDDPMPAHDSVGSDDVLDALSALIADRTLGRVWLIHADANPVGYAVLTFSYSLEFGGRCAFLDEFFIQRDHRRQGIAKFAMQWLSESAAPLLGIRTLFLEVSPDNQAASGLYQAVGFHPRPYRLLSHQVRKVNDA